MCLCVTNVVKPRSIKQHHPSTSQQLTSDSDPGLLSKPHSDGGGTRCTFVEGDRTFRASQANVSLDDTLQHTPVLPGGRAVSQTAAKQSPTAAKPSPTTAKPTAQPPKPPVKPPQTTAKPPPKEPPNHPTKIPNHLKPPPNHATNLTSKHLRTVP